MADRLRLGAGTTIVDLAAGTGKLTRQLVATGARVVAVEPLAPMRGVLRRVVPEAEALDGTAESIPLADAAADAVTVAAAFHWFRHDQAIPELHRVLREQGGLVVFWNKRDMSQPLQQAFQEILERHVGEVRAVANEDWRKALDDSTLFAPAGEARFPLVQDFDAELLVDRALSISFVAALPEPIRAETLRQIRSLADGLPELFPFRYTTEVYAWTRH